MKKLAVVVAILAVLLTVGMARADVTFDSILNVLYSNIKDVKVDPVYSLVERRIEAYVNKDIKDFGKLKLTVGLLSNEITKINDPSDLLKSFIGIGAGVRYELIKTEKIEADAIGVVGTKRIEKPFDFTKLESFGETDAYIGFRVRW